VRRQSTTGMVTAALFAGCLNLAGGLALAADDYSDCEDVRDFTGSVPPFRPGQVWELGYLYADREPPPMRAEAAPAYRPGYLWVSGYWGVQPCRFVWVRGYWLAERHGYVWQDAQWEPRGNGWRMRPGAWLRVDPAWPRRPARP
jgi:WXXGXW repeat (2 copies)